MQEQKHLVTDTEIKNEMTELFDLSKLNVSRSMRNKIITESARLYLQTKNITPARRVSPRTVISGVVYKNTYNTQHQLSMAECARMFCADSAGVSRYINTQLSTEE
jgi:hypothetical protein